MKQESVLTKRTLYRHLFFCSQGVINRAGIFFINSVRIAGAYTAFVLILFVWSASSPGADGSDPLTTEERAWLEQHDGKIVIGCDLAWPPFTFTGKDKTPEGISHDYRKLIEQKLDFRFKIAEPDLWENVKRDLFEKKIDVVPAMSRDLERSKKVLFSKPYFEVHSVIITGSKFTGELSLEKMHGMRVAVPRETLIHKHLKNSQSYLFLSPEKSVKSCLLAVVSGMVDAAVVNLASASYVIEHEAITNLKMAGYTRFETQLHFASRNDWPMLNVILNKGLDLISPEEKDAIFHKWVHMEMVPFYKKRSFWISVLVIAAFFAGVILFILILNRKLTHEVEKRTADLEKKTHDLTAEISARRKIEEELHKEQAHLHTVIETIPDLVWLKDPDGVYISCNLKFEEFFGAPENEIRGKTDYDFVSAEQADKFLALDREAVRKDASVKTEEEITYAVDGRTRQLETIKTPMYGPEGTLIGVLGIGRDITWRKEAEQEIIGSRDQLLSILSNIQGVTYRCKMDKEWTMIFMSGYVEQLTGYPAEEFISNRARTYESIVHREDTQQVSDTVHKAIRSGTPWELEYRIIHKNGEQQWVYEKGAAVLKKDGSIECLDGFIINITRQRVMEEHFTQTQKLESIGVLAGGIAHDFNNILGGILGFSELVQEDLKKIECPENIHKRVGNIIRGGLRAKELVAQILAFSRSEKYQVEPVNVSLVAKEVSHLLTATLPRTIEIKEEFYSKSMVLGDITNIHQVIMNLCTNAGYAMQEEGGVLSLSVTEVSLDADAVSVREDVSPGDFVLLSVEDTGHGMEEEIHQKIMEPFFTTKPKDKGTGMGLWVVRGIITAMGGFIKVTSKPGQGSRFDVFMPVFDKPMEKSSGDVDSKEQILTGYEHILFVDDEKTLTQFAKEFLSDLGYQVTIFNRPVKALESFRVAPELYDLVVTDMTMPGMTGDKLCREIRSVRPEMGVILTSGILENCSREIMEEFDAVLKKPVPINEMARTIRMVLKKV